MPMTQYKSTFLQYIFLILGCLCNLVCSQSRDSYDFIVKSPTFTCSHSENATVSFQNNVNILLSDFNQQSSIKAFYNTSVGDDPVRVYGYYLCRGDISLEVCNDCIFNGTQFAAGGCDYVDGWLISGMCMFRYSNFSMYGLWLGSITQVSNLEANVSNFQQYNSTWSSNMEALINEAAFESQNNGSVLGFATMEASVTEDQTIYSLAQCTPDIVGVNCSRCLHSAFSSFTAFAEGSPAAFATNNKCHLRYDNVSFYNLGE